VQAAFCPKTDSKLVTLLHDSSCSAFCQVARAV
jgi:hypothetical protein